jgi:hypothetical protein
MTSLIFVPPTPAVYRISRCRGGRPSGLQRDGRRAKSLRGNTSLAAGTFLKLAFHQTDAQRLAGDVSTGIFHPVVPLKFRKDIFSYFHTLLTQEACLLS